MNQSMFILLLLFGTLVGVVLGWEDLDCAEEVEDFIANIEVPSEAISIFDPRQESPEADRRRTNVVEMQKTCQELGPLLIQVREANPCWKRVDFTATKDKIAAGIMRENAKFVTLVYADITCGFLQRFF